MGNEWIGYSERGFVGALFHDLCGSPGAFAVLKHVLSESCANKTFLQAVSEANEITTILELGLSGFGDVDGIIVLRKAATPKAALFIEAKRKPLFAEWTDRIGDAGGTWNRSQAVVQIARKIALMKALENSKRGDVVQFTSPSDYWTLGPREMKLEKETVLALLDKFSVREVPTLAATLTASHWIPPRCTGELALHKILDLWSLAGADRPIHVGFETFLSAGERNFPLFCRTFSLCCWDTMFDGRNWCEWRSHAEDLYGAEPLVALEDWASREGLTWARRHDCSKKVNTLNRNRRAVARTRGCYGVGGPVLDLQFKMGTKFSIPNGWLRWDTGLTLPEAPLAGTRWNHNFLVPERSK